MTSPHTPENWTAAAADYDQAVTDFTSLYADAVLARLDLDPDHEVLEVAAGPGNITVRAGLLCRRLLATDYAPGMIARLTERVARAGLDHVTCAQMDGQALALDDASFDRAFSNFGVMLFADRAAGFAELRRVLRPGGRAVVSAWSGPDTFEAFGLFGAAVQQALPDLPAPPGPPPIFSLSDPAVFAAEMADAGFSDVRIDLVDDVFELPSKEAFWDLMRGSAPPARALFERIGEAQVGAVRDALFALLTERFGEGPLRLRAQATVGVGHVV